VQYKIYWKNKKRYHFFDIFFFSGTGSYFGLKSGLQVRIRFEVKNDALKKLKRS